MTEWKEVKLGRVIEFVSNRIPIDKATLETYISTANMLPDFGGVITAENLPTSSTINTFNEGDILFSNIRTYFKKVWYSKFSGTVSPDVLVFRAKDIDSSFLYYILCNPDFTEYTVLTSKGAKMPRGDRKAIIDYTLSIPPLPEQIAIASVLSSLDDKIDLLHKQNETLEEMAETLFRQWFVEEAEEDWEEKPLSSIATFLNGLACQKFPPKNDMDKLPVLKIRELRNGIGKDSDWCTTEVDEKYIVHNGDIIFSWSASLMVKVWNGETCILNQHLFKVTSEEYPKWFYWLWSKYHLREFIAIAKAHATTMGHIKRGDLDEAMALIPTQAEIEKMSKTMTPILDKIIKNSKQIRTLTQLRDTLLPKLMSGEVRVEN